MSYLKANTPFHHERMNVKHLLTLIGKALHGRRWGADHRNLKIRAKEKCRTKSKLDKAIEFQRVFCPSAKWQREVIDTLLQRSLSGVLTFRSLKPEMDRGLYQVIDGICRITSIDNFFNGTLKTSKHLVVNYGGIDLPMGDLTWQEIKQQHGEGFAQHIMDTEIGVDVFSEDMTNLQAAQKFRELNHGNPLSHQEIRQANQGELTTLIRSIARTGDEFPLLPLFDESIKGGMSLKRKRLNYDELMAKCLKLVELHLTKGSTLHNGYVDKDRLDELYRSGLQGKAEYSERLLNKYRKYVIGVVQIVHQTILAAPHHRMHTKTEPQIMSLFTLILELRVKYGETMTFDYPVFAAALWNALDYLTTKSNYSKVQLREHGGKGLKTPYVYLLPRVSPSELRKKFSLIHTELKKGKRMGFHLIDTGDFSRADVAFALDRQGGVCAGCGKPLTEETAQGDHIHAKQRGGTNARKNCQAMCQPCNGSKGKKTMKEWRTWKKQQKNRVLVSA